MASEPEKNAMSGSETDEAAAIDGLTQMSQSAPGPPSPHQNPVSESKVNTLIRVPFLSYNLHRRLFKMCKK